MNAAIQVGRDAFRNGNSVRSNPYLIHTLRHDQFVQGWHEAYQSARLAALRTAGLTHCC